MRIALIYSRQPGNQYTGGPSGVGDSENAWMAKLAGQLNPLLRRRGVDVETPPNTDYNRAGGITYADNVAWCRDRHRVKPFDLLISLHSNAMGNACILWGTSSASAAYMEKIRGALNAAKFLPFGDTWEKNTRKVAEVADTPPPAVLLEVGQHDRADYANWLRNAITNGELARNLDKALASALGLRNAQTAATTSTSPVYVRHGVHIWMINGTAGHHLTADEYTKLGRPKFVQL